MDGTMADTVAFNNSLGSELDVQSPRAKTNREALHALMLALRTEEDAIRLGGGAKAAEAQHAKGRLTVRERLKLLLDEGTEILELGLWAAYKMYGDFGGAPCAGVVTGLGRVCGRPSHCDSMARAYTSRVVLFSILFSGLGLCTRRCTK